jgi:glucokinase
MNGRPWLVADLGSTNARLALADPARGTLTNLVQTSTGNVTSLAELIAPHLSDLPARQHPAAACVAVAGPITGDWCEMTNAPLKFSISQSRQDLDLEELLVVNDFAATSRCLPHLGRAEYELIGNARVVLGPGTGLGLAAVVPVAGGWKVIAGEGGHVALSALHDDEIELIKLLRQRHGFASAEMAVSGPGLRLIYTALDANAGTNCVTPPSAAEIVRRRRPAEMNSASQPSPCSADCLLPRRRTRR